MDKFDQVEKLIQEAKHSHANMGKVTVPGAQYLAMEGVDQIPLGGESNANPQEGQDSENRADNA